MNCQHPTIYTFYTTFLVCCNFALLSFGMTVLILGIKMDKAMSAFSLTEIEIVGKVIKTAIATGVFISFSGASGICGTCYASTWLLMVHLVTLGIIVIMEFSLGVTLMLVKKTVEEAMESTACSNMCAANFDAVILEYALPSAGLMMTVIFVEALMIYSSIKLYFYIRDGGKSTSPPGTPAGVQNVQMQNAPQSTYITDGQPTYGPQMVCRSHQPQPGYTTPRIRPQDIEQQPLPTEAKPPEYNSLPSLPPHYRNSREFVAADETMPKENEVTFNPV